MIQPQITSALPCILNTYSSHSNSSFKYYYNYHKNTIFWQFSKSKQRLGVTNYHQRVEKDKMTIHLTCYSYYYFKFNNYQMNHTWDRLFSRLLLHFKKEYMREVEEKEKKNRDGQQSFLLLDFTIFIKIIPACKLYYK